MGSNVAGYLEPNSQPAPLEDAALEDFFHDIIVGLSGLPDDKVRPMWQEEPPTQPGRSNVWLAFGITIQPGDTYAAEVHDPVGEEGQGVDQFQRHETLEISMICFGPNSGATMRLLRDSVQIEQNRAVLTANGFGFQETTDIIHGPVLAKSKYQQRSDMKLIVRRAVVRDFQVLNILESDITLDVGLATVQPSP